MTYLQEPFIWWCSQCCFLSISRCDLLTSCYYFWQCVWRMSHDYKILSWIYLSTYQCPFSNLLLDLVCLEWLQLFIPLFIPLHALSNRPDATFLHAQYYVEILCFLSLFDKLQTGVDVIKVWGRNHSFGLIITVTCFQRNQDYTLIFFKHNPVMQYKMELTLLPFTFPLS